MLAGELARLREESGRSLAELASLTTFDRSYLHKLERGEKLGSAQVMAALDAVYETGRHLQLLWQLGKEDAFRDKYRRFMELEQEATVRYEYVSNTVPGLLQTRAYAEDLLRAARPKDEHELEEQVAARLGRQEILTREDPPHYRALLDEAALRRTPVDSKIWQEQLEHLLEVADLPNVMLQIVPLSAGLHGLVGTSLTILWLADGSAVAYTESGYSGDLTEEPGEVERLKLSYDLLRDLALPPNASAQFIRTLLEETSCPDPS
ncbi:XRE family transcriptional regulator [Streptomyces sp. Z26]|nr:XRE family transcriptional regulator [Streptomyces sp. Z26]